MRFRIAAEHRTPTNEALVAALHRLGVEAAIVGAREVRHRVGRGDTVLGRIDVNPALDGLESCLFGLRPLELDGVRFLNRPNALLASHDKLATALRLGRRGLPHPRTAHVDTGARPSGLVYPVVVKPRFGSWGRDVSLCEDEKSLARCLRRSRQRRWFRKHGALVQELVSPCGFDLRVVVACGEVVGAVERVAAPGEWRTNITLGARRRPVDPPEPACRLAIAAAEALGIDLVGVDLLPVDDGFVVLELNGAVDFTAEYSLDGRDVFDRAAAALVSLDRAASLAPVGVGA
jgi:RimK family alpha-L-glutamate ligase